jgi:hypothetical protein
MFQQRFATTQQAVSAAAIQTLHSRQTTILTFLRRMEYPDPEMNAKVRSKTHL